MDISRYPFQQLYFTFICIHDKEQLKPLVKRGLSGFALLESVYMASRRMTEPNSHDNTIKQVLR